MMMENTDLNSLEIAVEPVPSGLGAIEIVTDEGASSYEGVLQFLAIYEHCSDYQPIGNGLLGLRRNDHTKSVLTTAELYDAVAVKLATDNQDPASVQWVSSAVPGEYHIGRNCLYVKIGQTVRVFYAASGNEGSLEISLLSETDLDLDFNHNEILPWADLEFLKTCPSGTFRRTHPNWTFIRLR